MRKLKMLGGGNVQKETVNKQFFNLVFDGKPFYTKISRE